MNGLESNGLPRIFKSPNSVLYKGPQLLILFVACDCGAKKTELKRISGKTQRKIANAQARLCSNCTGQQIFFSREFLTKELVFGLGKIHNNSMLATVSTLELQKWGSKRKNKIFFGIFLNYLRTKIFDEMISIAWGDWVFDINVQGATRQ